MMSSAAIRQQFLDFFESKGHRIVPSAPMVLKNDPTLLFTNAGMNQFKDYFLGNQKAPHPRVADTQKCLRVSGKHNDLEEVGVDTYHHTMFEMLGNWSFGDPANPSGGYFKKEAIAWSWELLTEVYRIPKDRLYVTVFRGDSADNLPEDKEAFEEWTRWIDPERIILASKKDNFWEMGDTGPCGPCTEIHVDCRSDEERARVEGKTLVNQDDPQVIEIWNNVFIQFNRLADGRLEPLPAKHVDTGMGLERLVRVLQQKNSNYDTDLFTGSISSTEKLTGHRYQAGDSRSDIAFRVIADHIRAIAFAIADGQLPSNNGAGYVIRRILRRAVRYAYSWLGAKEPLLHKLIPGLAEQFAAVFPELRKQEEFVTRVIREEEEAFLRTLEKGLKKMDDLAQKAAGTRTIDGKSAFELYDTYGFPIDLTRLIASESGLTVDEAGFTREMEKQKERSRAAADVETGDWVNLLDETGIFTGYEKSSGTARIIKYRRVKTPNSHIYQLVLDQTPFYAESGGQVGDTGTLTIGADTIAVTNTIRENDLILHITDSLPQSPGEPVEAQIDEARRHEIRNHHTATHLLHAALRKVLGEHVTQKGSLVNDEQLRFDFAHFSKVTDEEIQQIEQLVNQKIRQNIPVVTREMPREDALKLGAMALFGEKYGDTVRVVIIDPQNSTELCGGTHAGNTGDLGIFRISHETAVASGVRRIEAHCSLAAENRIFAQNKLVKQLNALLKNPKDLLSSVQQLQEDHQEMRRKLEQLEQKQLSVLAGELAAKAQSINGIMFIGAITDVSSADNLKKLCYDLKARVPGYLAVLCAAINGRAFVAIGMDESVSTEHGLDASKLIKELAAPLIKGGGGGQKTLATAGGQVDTALQQVIDAVQQKIGG